MTAFHHHVRFAMGGLRYDVTNVPCRTNSHGNSHEQAIEYVDRPLVCQQISFFYTLISQVLNDSKILHTTHSILSDSKDIANCDQPTDSVQHDQVPLPIESHHRTLRPIDLPSPQVENCSNNHEEAEHESWKINPTSTTIFPRSLVAFGASSSPTSLLPQLVPESIEYRRRGRSLSVMLAVRWRLSCDILQARYAQGTCRLRRRRRRVRGG